MDGSLELKVDRAIALEDDRAKTVYTSISTSVIQWNLLNKDTFGTSHCVLCRKVVLFQR